MSNYKNGRMHIRAPGGQFRKLTGVDVGIGGVCPKCNHLLLRHYDGNENERPLDPMKLRYRCFTCEPLKASDQ